MKKIFIAQAMTGLSSQEVEDRRNAIIKCYNDTYPDDVDNVEFLDQFHIEHELAPDVKYRGVSYLGDSLKYLARADLVIFDSQAILMSKGTNVEQFICSTYDIPVILYLKGKLCIQKQCDVDSYTLKDIKMGEGTIWDDSRI